MYFSSGKKFIEFLEKEGGGIVCAVEEVLLARKRRVECGAQNGEVGKIDDKSSDEEYQSGDGETDDLSAAGDPSSPSYPPAKESRERKAAEKTTPESPGGEEVEEGGEEEKPKRPLKGKRGAKKQRLLK